MAANVDKKILELDQRIVAEEDGRCGWIGRLPLLDIEAWGDSHDEAVQAAFRMMLDKLRDMPEADAKAWIESNSSPGSVFDLPECSIRPIG